MRDFLKSLSPASEFVIVIAGAFGLFILSGIAQALMGPRIDVSDDDLQWLLLYETAVLAALGVFLHVRGWAPAHLGLAPRWRDLPVGLALALAVHAAYFVGALVAGAVFSMSEPSASE